MADSDSTTPASKPTRLRLRARTRPIMPRIYVSIDKETIDEAIRRQSRHCFISEAVMKAAPYLDAVVTDSQLIRCHHKEWNLRYFYITPPIVNIRLIAFDRELEVLPFSFKLISPVKITRKVPQPEHPLTEEEKSKRLALRKRQRREVKQMLTPPDLTEPFETPREYAEKVVSLMKDPNAPLGPMVLLRHPKDNREGNVENRDPIMVGGSSLPRLPRRLGQFKTTRKYGLREWVE